MTVVCLGGGETFELFRAVCHRNRADVGRVQPGWRAPRRYELERRLAVAVLGLLWRCTDERDGLPVCDGKLPDRRRVQSERQSARGHHLALSHHREPERRNGHRDDPLFRRGRAVGAISAPAGNQTYSVGQPVSTTFGCTDSANAPGIRTCTDSNGVNAPSGTLDTSTPGRFTYAVTATSQD